MKVLQVLCQHPGYTGSGIFLQALARTGNDTGTHFGVVAGVAQDSEVMVAQKIHPANFFPVLFETDDLPFPVVGMSDVMPYPSTRYQDLTDEMLESWERSFYKTLLRAKKEFRPELVLGHHLWLLTSLTRKIMPDVPIYGICHGTCLRQYQLVPRLAGLAREGCRELDGVFALHEEHKEEIHRLLKIPKDRILVSGAGYHPEIFYPSKTIKSITSLKLVYAGKLSAAKGVPSLMRVFDQLTKKNHDLELHLVGSGGERIKKEIITQVRTGSRIFFHGQLSQEALAELFRSAHLFVLPSFFEGLPLVVLEALASGLRVVTTDLPGLRQYLGPVIEKSGMITYVNLPSLRIDVPEAGDLPVFEEQLHNALQLQISFVRQRISPSSATREAIQALSWQRVWERMRSSYQNKLLKGMTR
ncbi:MAG: glycosyltransferase family 4 protein [Dehalobacterium sp.]|jgi:glycosyltransferase involved in cell wall biosynthesis